MNTVRQLLALLKFHASVNPFIAFICIALGAQPLFMHVLFQQSNPNLSSLLFVQNLFFVFLICHWILAPDLAQSWGKNTAWNSGTEFLLTRAIEKRSIYRTRAFLVYVVVLAIPLICLVYSLRQPDIRVTEYSARARELCLQSVAGASLSPDPDGGKVPLIVMPFGNVLIELWHVWLFVTWTLFAQCVLMLVYPLKARQFAFYGIFLTVIFAQCAASVLRAKAVLASQGEMVPLGEKLFFIFAGHQAVFWILTVVALIACQLVCERRFAAQEH